MYFYTHIRSTYYITISAHRNYIQYHQHPGCRVQHLTVSVWKLVHSEEKMRLKLMSY